MHALAFNSAFHPLTVVEVSSTALPASDTVLQPLSPVAIITVAIGPHIFAQAICLSFDIASRIKRSLREPLVALRSLFFIIIECAFENSIGEIQDDTLRI
jgi:hypothetical protein